ncbi:MAG: hypothetical protein ACO1N0_11140 [Fluviicola sp.]
MAQIEDPIWYNPHLIGNWELRAYVTLNNNDTLQINQDSVYWNLILRIEADSITEDLIPTGTRRDLPNLKDKCKWSIYREEAQTWITIPCGQNVRGEHEIVFVSETELRTRYLIRETEVELLFQRIE